MWLSCDHMIRGKLWMMSTHFKSPSWQVWWLQASCKRRYFVFSLSRDLMWLHGERDTWHYGGVSLVISEYHANFDGHRPFGRGEIKLSICHVTSHNRGTRRSCDIMGEITLSQVAPPVKFGGHRVCGIGDIKRLICHMTSPGWPWVSFPHQKLQICQVLWP